MIATNEHRGIVIDNTNCTKDQRAGYVKLANELGYRLIALVFKVDKDTCFFMDKSRESNLHRQHLSKKVGSIPIHTFFKKYEPPTDQEGFQIFEVNPVLRFESPEDEEFFSLLR